MMKLMLVVANKAVRQVFFCFKLHASLLIQVFIVLCARQQKSAHGTISKEDNVLLRC
jgi:hypothetical protein